MDFKKVTFLLIVSFTASLLIRTTGTLFPQVFQNVYAVKLTVITNVFFIGVQGLFYICFLREYTANRKRSLKTACWLSIIGTFLVAVIYLKNACLVFGLNIFPLFLMNRYFETLIPLLSAFFFLLFFVTFKKVQSQWEYKTLNRPISSAIIGSVIFVIHHLVVLTNLFISHTFNRLEHMHRDVAVGTIPLIVLAAVLILHFYFRFFQYQQSKPMGVK